MARSEDTGLMPSLLDRLTDPESSGTAWKRGYTPEKMSQAVLRDLEDLLNTRQSHSDLPDDYPELKKSILAYGLPDLVSLNAISMAQRAEIGHYIEEIVTRFEPRLRDVRVHLIESGRENLERSVRFHVESRLCVDPAPEVAFETILQLTTGHYTVGEPNLS